MENKILDINQKISEEINVLVDLLGKLDAEGDAEQRKHLMIKVTKELFNVSKLNLESTMVIADSIIK